MADDFFDKVRDAARDKGINGLKKDAQNFFRNQVRELRKGVTPGQLMRESPDLLVGKGNLALGKMYMFFYDPKLKKELPYYDRFPLIFVLDRANTTGKGNKGFLGFNLHYMPVKRRIEILGRLDGILSNQRFDETTKSKLTYGIIQSNAQFKYARPAIKQYLNSHVRSRFLLIPADQWLPAAFLPVSRFEKASKQKVWADTRKMIQ